ncbi:MAG: response regulator transcription factor [Deltaproteobacteria bacterium]|nr:response regulator transcription factor [Deltaproteobacteria bacterium]
MQTLKKKIFIVDDHPIVRGGLAQLINQEEDMMSVGEAGNATEAIQGIEKLKPDLVLMDISLEGSNGIELTKGILAEHPEICVLIISMYDESLYLESALRAGAKGYLTKQLASDHVVVAIRTVLKGDIYISDKWKDKLTDSKKPL